MLADNLEVLLKIIGINDFPTENVADTEVSMDFHSDLFSLIQEGIQNVAFLKNEVKRVTPNQIVCELRECVEGVWYRVKLTVYKGETCRVSLTVLGKDNYTDSEGFRVKGVARS